MTKLGNRLSVFTFQCENNYYAQHLWGLSLSCSNNLGSCSPCGTQQQDSVQEEVHWFTKQVITCFHFSEPWFWVLFWRGSVKLDGLFISFHSVDTIVSYLTNAPLVPPGTWVVSILYKCLGWLDHNFIIAL